MAAPINVFFIFKFSNASSTALVECQYALLAPKSITKSKVDNYRVKLVWIGRQLHLSQGQTI